MATFLVRKITYADSHYANSANVVSRVIKINSVHCLFDQHEQNETPTQVLQVISLILQPLESHVIGRKLDDLG